jgi:hypothetical protein
LADVRYLAPLIPLCVWLGVRTWQSICDTLPCKSLPKALPKSLTWLLFLVVCGTNVVHLPWSPGSWQSTPVLLAEELIAPRTTTLEQTIAWIRANVPARKSVWVVPGYQAYPLMVQAPEPIYAWQLDGDVGGELAELPAIHYLGREPVDYVIVFGPLDDAVHKLLAGFQRPGSRYRRELLLELFHEEGTRPELYEHLFKPVTQFDRSTEAVYLYRRMDEESRK